MLILGLDPGTRKLGWGVVQRQGGTVGHVDHGVICMDADKPLAARLHMIEVGLTSVVERFKPAAGAVEGLFFHKDAQAAAKLGHARGVVLLVLQRAGLEIAEYAPAFVKRSITGHGRAGKTQVEQMVLGLLGLAEVSGHDASDALAIAITHSRSSGLPQALSPSIGRKRGSRRGRLSKKQLLDLSDSRK